MVDPISSSLTTLTATKLLGRAVDDLYDFLKDKVSLTIDKKRVQRRIPALADRINSFRMVKTLWQIERPVDVEEFYCTSHVLIPTTVKLSQIGRQTHKKRMKIDCVSDFGNIGNIVISGIAGQGKSIFLRHLFIREFELGRRIPIFIELRKIEKDESLLDHISRFLDILDLGIDSRLSRILARSGKFIYFLDAYDEVPEIQKQRTLSELEYLAGTSPGSQFIVTTRPDSGIEMSSLFTVVNLDDLINNEYLGVIRKLSADVQFANTLIKSIRGHKATLCDLLCTPLLITLLIIQYNSFQKLPEQMSDFYESIFDVLLRRHDRSKPGFVRQRLCSINDNQYREIFNAFCFETQKIDKSQFSLAEIQNAISKAMQIVNADEDSLNFLKDITNITCLLLHEGDEHRFIHKSVQEYYAASFIKNRPDNLPKNFYHACMSDYFISNKWKQELGFLSEIDKYRYSKYYLLPLCHKYLNVNNDNDLINGCPDITEELIRNTVGFHIVGLKNNINNSFAYYHCNTLEQILDEGNYLELMNLDYTDLFSRIKEKTISVNKELLKGNYSDLVTSHPRTKNDEYISITVEQIKKEGYYVDEITSLATRIVNDIYLIWRETYSYIDREDSFNITADIGI